MCIRDSVPVTVRGAYTLDVARLSGNEEATIQRAHWGKMPLSVSAQIEPITGIHLSDLRLDTVEISGEQQIDLSISVEILGQDAVDRRDLSLERQRDHRECSVAIIPDQGCCKRVRFFYDGVFEILLGAHIRYLSLIHISEPTRLGMISYAVFCLKK